MANETSGKDGEWGPFERGGAYPEVGPELGSLHDAWDVGTGKPVVMLLPTELVKWNLEGSWRVSLLCAAHPPSVTVRVEEAPASVRLSELTDIFVLTTAAFTRTEDSPRLQAHIALDASLPTSLRRSRSSAIWKALSLGLSVGSLLSLSEDPGSLARDEASASREMSSALAELEERDPTTLSYAMPEKPFRNQVVPPCTSKTVAVEINGGCWLELVQKPPCGSDSAEHKGKCFMPVARFKTPPTAVEP